MEEYLIVDLNATQVAIRAGYKKSEYTDTNANKILENTRVAEEIDKGMVEWSRRTGINQDRVIQELARIVFVNSHDVINPEDASVRPDATKDNLACIQSVKVKTSCTDKGDMTEREVRLNDKIKALELLGMWKDKVEVSGLEEQKNKLDNILQQMRGDG